MDDEPKKPSGRSARAPGDRKTGNRTGGTGPKGGKPGFRAKGDKPGFGGKKTFGEKKFGGKSGGFAAKGGKPFRDGDRPAAKARFSGDTASGERQAREKPFRRREGDDAGERPAKSFRRSDEPRGEGRPFKPRGDKPFAPRDGSRPFKPREDRSFKPRDDGGEASGERAAKPYRPRPEGKSFSPREDRPFKQREERSFTPRGDGDSRPGRHERSLSRRDDTAARPERPSRSDAGDRPFTKRRPDSGEGDRTVRRFEREDRPREQGDRPRRFDRDGDGQRSPRKPFEKRDAGPSRPSGERKPFSRAPISAEEGGERIAKRLARVGIASRRDAEDLIAAGRVRVNGKVLASPAVNVTAEDVIELDGNLLPPIERTRLFLFHKPAGVVTTNRDPEGRRTVFDVLPADLPRLITVGRLDINTEGLLLLTNDGGLARTLELPATGWLRRYRARVHGKVEESALAALKDGIAVDGVFYGSIEASLDREQGTNAWLTIGLREGKNREVKNILGALGLDVTRLIRISFGPFQLGELPEGHVQELKGRMLRDQLGERLIEESGANFEADIVKPFSNKPKSREERPESEPHRTPRPLAVGEGGLIKARGRSKDRIREDALGRLSTKPDRGGFGDKPGRGTGGGRFERGAKPDAGDRPPRGKKFGEREQRPVEPPGQRKANVWMAPGSRPQGAGRLAAEKAAAEEAKKSRKPAYGKPGGAKPFGKPRGEGRDGKGGPGDRPVRPRKPRDDE
ncbi:pseudouridine synthase [Mesorhizobium sp. LHD-90]|uniref:pseudouridine synthase n=1 Tax=Mesorhizobium sp. LHD-90 TaxID=3071414 RepID=UPI0027E08F11|nr:pseudouridine synthase [Mesorhizobium sp. LHD-90]MDQ6435058.1 pseudouridine synthase [Mesorhizobium sp. LHD-90]